MATFERFAHESEDDARRRLTAQRLAEGKLGALEPELLAVLRYNESQEQARNEKP